MKVSNRFSSVVKVIAHFPRAKVTFSCYINKHFQLYAKFEGTVLHLNSEKACRYIRGSDRKAGKEVLKHKLLRLHHLEQL